jgi:hypothetical protein
MNRLHHQLRRLRARWDARAILHAQEAEKLGEDTTAGVREITAADYCERFTADLDNLLDLVSELKDEE